MKTIFSGYFILSENVCVHRAFYAQANTLAEAIEIAKNHQPIGFELLKSSVEEMCLFDELDENEKRILENKKIYIFDAEWC